MITPMQKGINTVGDYISDKLDALADMKQLIAENEKLKAEVESLQASNISLVMDKYELDSLRALYSVGEKYADYPKIAARVISNDSNSYYNSFTIDKGSQDGITVDMNVLAGNGLCGIVVEVGKNYSKVRAIIDDASYVSGMFLRTSDTCDVKGDLQLLDTGYIRVESISINAEVEDNYEVVTSQISDKYLPGILIGYISNIELDSNNLVKKAYLTPVVDFEHLEDVLVITQLKQPLEDFTEQEKMDRILNAISKLNSSSRTMITKQLEKQLSQKETKNSILELFSNLSDKSKKELLIELEKLLSMSEEEPK